MRIVRIIFKTLLFGLFAVVLLLVGTLFLLYSPWSQDMLRDALDRRFGGPDADPRISVESFRLRPPLSLELAGVCIIQHGDTLVAADSLEADVALLPLLGGAVRIDRADLRGGYYRIGAPDSAMCLTIRASRADIAPASVRLANMGIDVDDAVLQGCCVDMILNPDTAAASDANASADTSDMTIRLRHLRADDLRYSMRMLPTIDSLGATLTQATLLDGAIDMRSQTIGLRSLSGSALKAAYIAPDSATIAATPVAPESESTSKPWTVAIDSIDFDNSEALYTTRGVIPEPGLDFAYITVDSLALRIRDFYNQASTVVVPIQLSGRERCGLQLDVAGTLRVDSTSLRLDTCALSTPTATSLAFNYMMGMGDLTDPKLPMAVTARGHASTADLRTMFPAFAPYLIGLPAEIEIDAAADGTMGTLYLQRLDMAMNGCVAISLDGTISNPMLPDRIGADIDINGRITDAAPIARTMLDASTMKTVKIPPMTLAGHVRMRDGNQADGRLRTVVAGSGSLALDGSFDMHRESYDAKVNMAGFPVNAFMPLLGVGSVTANLNAKGAGFDFFSPKTSLNAHADVSSAQYGGHTYRGITADAKLAGGNAEVDLNSTDPDMLAHITASGNLAGERMDWKVYADAHLIDLKALNFAADESSIVANLRADASYAPATGYMSADVDIDDLQMRSPTSEFSISDVRAALAADTTVRADIINRDLRATASIYCPLDTLLARTDSITAAIDTIMASRRLNAVRLQRAIPRFDINARGGNDNMVNDILAGSKMSIDSLTLTASNAATLSLQGRVLGVKSPSMRIDTAAVDLTQFGNNLFFNVNADNRPGTMDEFAHVALSGMVMDNLAAMRIKQRNIEDKTGYDIGLQASITDSIVRASIMPLDPVIGYKPWTVNAGNFVSINTADKHVDANIRMKGDSSSLDLYTEHVNGSHDQEDLVLNISDIHVQDWIALNPFAPPVKGDVSAEIRLNYNERKQLNGRGNIDLANFFYGGQPVAHIQATADVSTSPGGVLDATADISFDGRRAITLRGALNDSTQTSPLNLDLSMISLPLSVANPFLGPSLGRLNGTLNGTIDIAGSQEAPTLNGWLALDSASVFLTMTGTDYRITADTVPVRQGHVQLNDFSIYGVNNNPLTLNGNVDISNFADPRFDVAIKGRDVQLVNTRRAARGSDIYGKAFIDLDASAAGSMAFMRINAALSILSGTNVTYVMPDAATVLQSQSVSDMVKFVNFSDSTAVMQADSVAQSGMAMLLDATVTFQPASTISVDLSADGKNKAQLQPTGELAYSMTPMSADGRLTGRLNINDGFVRYSPPFMGEKNFKFNPDSYVAFNGDMMNPTLNIHAVDVMKANVTQEGQNSRLVNFDVILSVTGTLEHMDVAFDLSTDDDITVSNELQSMSPEQRANQAMNMLLYKTYTGPGTKGTANIGGNMLYSFLESQLNSWAANNIRGVDISFGVDQYDRTLDGSTSQTTSYSYQVSKSLFDDRFKIVVGGNYSTDANADENFSQNLINDISFEYFLNRAQTMYIRLFRHTGYESILEGEITQTGVGFVYKRKLNSLRDIFRRRKRQ